MFNTFTVCIEDDNVCFIIHPNKVNQALPLIWNPSGLMGPYFMFLLSLYYFHKVVNKRALHPND